jgi:hypothetical protein
MVLVALENLRDRCFVCLKMDIWGLSDSEHIIKDIGGLKSKRKEKKKLLSF